MSAYSEGSLRTHMWNKEHHFIHSLSTGHLYLSALCVVLTSLSNHDAWSGTGASDLPSVCRLAAHQLAGLLTGNLPARRLHTSLLAVTAQPSRQARTHRRQSKYSPQVSLHTWPMPNGLCHERACPQTMWMTAVQTLDAHGFCYHCMWCYKSCHIGSDVDLQV